jgi:hypothetical protein
MSELFIPKVFQTGTTRRRYNFYSVYSRRHIFPISIYIIIKDTILYVILRYPHLTVTKEARHYETKVLLITNRTRY